MTYQFRYNVPAQYLIPEVDEKFSVFLNIRCEKQIGGDIKVYVDDLVSACAFISDWYSLFLDCKQIAVDHFLELLNEKIA